MRIRSQNVWNHGANNSIREESSQTSSEQGGNVKGGILSQDRLLNLALLAVLLQSNGVHIGAYVIAGGKGNGVLYIGDTSIPEPNFEARVKRGLIKFGKGLNLRENILEMS